VAASEVRVNDHVYNGTGTNAHPTFAWETVTEVRNRGRPDPAHYRQRQGAARRVLARTRGTDRGDPLSRAGGRAGCEREDQARALKGHRPVLARQAEFEGYSPPIGIESLRGFRSVPVASRALDTVARLLTNERFWNPTCEPGFSLSWPVSAHAWDRPWPRRRRSPSAPTTPPSIARPWKHCHRRPSAASAWSSSWSACPRSARCSRPTSAKWMAKDFASPASAASTSTWSRSRSAT
jgi:hypothetical protein